MEWSGGNLNGVFDGNGHTIVNMSLVATFTDTEKSFGLFSKCLGGVIFNLSISNATVLIDITSDDGKNYENDVGALVGTNDSSLVIFGCTVDEDSSIFVNNSSEKTYYDDYVGGFVGYSGYSFCSFDHCVNSASVSGGGYVGGLIGRGQADVKITNSINIGVITCLTSYGYASGIAGILVDSCFVTDSYNIGLIKSFGNRASGIVGNNNSSSNVINCFTLYGDISSDNYCIIKNCYSVNPASNHNNYGSNYEQFGCTLDDLSSKEFYKNKLLWDETVWNFDGIDASKGAFPIFR